MQNDQSKIIGPVFTCDNFIRTRTQTVLFAPCRVWSTEDNAKIEKNTSGSVAVEAKEEKNCSTSASSAVSCCLLI